MKVVAEGYYCSVLDHSALKIYLGVRNITLLEHWLLGRLEDGCYVNYQFRN